MPTGRTTRRTIFLTCRRCQERPASKGHSWCRACHAAWQNARYAVRAQTEPAFVAANNARSWARYHRRHPRARTRRPFANQRERTLTDGERWCWWCQEAHATQAFAPRPGTHRGVSYSCREGLRILTRAWRRRARASRAKD